MKRASPSTRYRNIVAMLLVAMLVGCASLKDSKESIIHVSASRNSAEAARLTLLGVKVLHHGDVDRATTKFMAAIHADDTYGPAHNNLGLLHYEQGNLYQAVLAFEQAMDLMPQDPVVYYNLGLSLETAGKTFEANDLYLQAVEMDPVNPVFLGNLVRLRVRMGESDPILVSQLQDLILIETRPDWRRWADRQLALRLNLSLDRGPASPDFDGGEDEDREDDDTRLQDNIIELTPAMDDDAVPIPPQAPTGNRTRSLPQTLSGPVVDKDPTDSNSRIEILPAPIQPEPTQPEPSIPDPDRSGADSDDRLPDGGPPPVERPRPAPIEDDGSLSSLPPSIRLAVEPDSSRKAESR